MKFMSYNLFFILLTLCVWSGCNRHPENNQLKALDATLKSDAQTVLEQLNAIDPAYLSRPDRCYYYLLKASAIDKTYTGLTNEDSLLRESETFYAKKEDYYNLARTEYYMAKCFSLRDSVQAAHMLFRKAKDHFEKTDQSDPHLGGLIYYQLGCLENSPEDIPTSKIYFERSQEMFTKAYDTVAMLYSMAQLIRLESFQGNLIKANSLATEILKQIDLLKNISAKQLINLKINTFYIISSLYQKDADFPKASTFIKETISIYKQSGRNIPADLYHFMAKLYRRQNQTDSTRYYYNRALDIASKSNSMDLLPYIYKELATLEEEQGDYKIVSQLQDRYYESEITWLKICTNNSLRIMEKKHDIFAKEQEIIKQKVQLMNVRMIVFGILFILIIALLLLFRQNKRLRIHFDKLRKDVQHTYIGFPMMKELTSLNYSIYEEIDRILAKNRVPACDPKLYKQLNDIFVEQRKEYALNLLSRLTRFDGLFITKLLEKYPDFTTEDLILAGMVCHHWFIPEIAVVFDISEDTARKRRSRLKNKLLGVKATIEDLEIYLQGLIPDIAIETHKKTNSSRQKKEQKDDVTIDQSENVV